MEVNLGEMVCKVQTHDCISVILFETEKKKEERNRKYAK